MHYFQPCDCKEIELNVFKMIGEDWFALVSQKGDKVNAMTASWGGMGVMWGKNVVFCFVRDSRFTKELLDDSEYFSINFLDAKKYKTTLRYLGAASGRSEDKIAAMKLTVNYHENTPYLDEARVVFACRKLYSGPIDKEGIMDPEILPKWYDKGDYHTLFIGEIVQMLAR